MATSSIISKVIGSFKDEEKVKVFSDVDPFKEISNWITTGSPAVDYHLSTYGIPPGVVEIRGDSQSGKTTFSLHLMKETINASNEDCLVVVLSSERRDNKKYAKDIGVDVDKVIVVRVTTIEDVFNKVGQFVEKNEQIREEEELTNKCKYLFIWDSLGGTISAQEKEKKENSQKKDEEDSASVAMGAAARAISSGFRYVTGLVHDNDMTFIFVNRPVSKIGVTFGEKEKSYGGKSVELTPTMRFHLDKGSTIKIDDEPVGQLSRVHPFKNDFSPRRTKAEFPILWGVGIVLSKWDIDFALEEGIVEPFNRGGFSFMNGKLKVKSMNMMFKAYLKGPRTPERKLLEILRKRILKAVHKKIKEERTIDEEEQ